MQQRVLLLGIEARRVVHPHLHRVAQRAFDPALFAAAQTDRRQQRVVEVFDAPRIFFGQVGMHARRVIGCVGQRHQRARVFVETEHGAATDQHLGASIGQVETPQVRAALLLGTEQQRLAIVLPAQRCVRLVVPLPALHRPLRRLALPQAQLHRHRVLGLLMAGEEGDAVPVRAVARCVHVPTGITRQLVHLAGLQRHFVQREARIAAFLLGGVDDEDHPVALWRDIEVLAPRFVARQFIRRAFEQVAHAARAGVHHQQVRHAVHRQVVVPAADHRLARGIARFLALAEGLVPTGLCLGAFEFGPHPRDEGDAPAVGKPGEFADTGCHRADAPRFAAIGCDQVQLRFVVLFALLLSLGDEGDLVAAR
ncbi:MAG: hypothetical protein ABIR94_12745 [Rubrivivax sp.]